MAEAVASPAVVQLLDFILWGAVTGGHIRLCLRDVAIIQAGQAVGMN